MISTDELPMPEPLGMHYVLYVYHAGSIKPWRMHVSLTMAEVQLLVKQYGEAGYTTSYRGAVSHA